MIKDWQKTKSACWRFAFANKMLFYCIFATLEFVKEEGAWNERLLLHGKIDSAYFHGIPGSNIKRKIISKMYATLKAWRCDNCQSHVGNLGGDFNLR